MAGDAEMEEVKRRLLGVENSNLAQTRQLASLSEGQAVIVTNMTHMSKAMDVMMERSVKTAETVDRWKGAVLLIMGAAPILGPLVTFAIRLVFFGKPLSGQ